MRTALSMAIGLAVIVGVVPASFAQDSQILDHGKAAGTAIEAENRQTQQRPVSNRGISLAVPTGRVSVGPKLEGEPIYVRRMTVREGMTIVEVSTTPFMPVLSSKDGPRGDDGSIGRPDQPAGW